MVSDGAFRARGVGGGGGGGAGGGVLSVVGFERHAEDGDRLAVERSVAKVTKLFDHPGLHAVVHADDRLHDALRDGVFLPDPGQRAGVLRKAGAAIAGTCMQELVPDPPSRPMPLDTSLTSAPTRSQSAGDLVDEGDLWWRERRWRPYLIISADSRSVVMIGEIAQEKRAVDLGHHLGRALGLHADNDAVGPHEIRRWPRPRAGIRGWRPRRTRRRGSPWRPCV